MGKVRTAIVDRILLVIASILVAGAGFYALYWSDEHHVSESWTWGTWFGLGSFACTAGFLRSKFKQRGFVLFCIGWFPIHMLVMFVAALRLTPLVSILPVTLELWAGLTVAFWLYGRTPQGK